LPLVVGPQDKVSRRERSPIPRSDPPQRRHAQGRPLALVLTPGLAHDVQGFGPLMRMVADHVDALLADRGYNADVIQNELADANVEAVIAAKRNRRSPAPHDRARCRWRNRIERLFNRFES